MLGWFDRVFDGRELELLGYMRQRVPANWKLMFENIKDPYHASAAARVPRDASACSAPINPSVTEMDETGRHSRAGVASEASSATEATAEMQSLRAT